MSPGLNASAGVVVVERDGRVWVVHPTNGFGGYLATWPKGRVEGGLSFQATAVREAWEEAGLKVRITGILGDFDRTTTRTRYYVGERAYGTPAEAGWESQACTLAPIDALPSLLNGSADAPVLAALKARLAPGET
nr:NUDIX hydrolase [Aromatoleum diolicum]